MAILRDDEIRRLLKFLGSVISDKEKLTFIEDELRGEFGREILREPEILRHFSAEIIEAVFNKIEWRLRIIPYTKMRLVQRGINLKTLVDLFLMFLTPNCVNKMTVKPPLISKEGWQSLRLTGWLFFV